MTQEQTHRVAMTVNGVVRTLQVPARRLLSDALRHDLGLTGTHVGCEHGVCGCCTVLVDGRPARSCLMFAVGADGSDVTTVEGLAAADGSLHPVQQAFVDCHALQCGFCTPGFLMTIKAFLEENPGPTDDDVVEGISGNLCRCTGYQNIIAAVHRAAELLQVGAEPTATPASPPAGDRGGESLDALDEAPPPQSVGQPAPYGPAGDGHAGVRPTGEPDGGDA